MSADVTLVPYARISAAQFTLTDECMQGLWREIVSDGTSSDVFTRVVTADEFLAYLQQPGYFPVVAFDDDGPCSIAWLNNVEDRSAFCHHVFLRRVWGRTIPIASRIIDYWFGIGEPSMRDGTHLIDVLIGITPCELRLARRFAQRLGFTRLTPDIPRVGGAGITLSYLERETWVKAAAAAAAEA